MHEPLEKLFGLKARRFADIIGKQGRDAYDALGIAIDAKLNSLILALKRHKGATSTELSSQTGLSRQLVEARLLKMMQQGLVESEADCRDARRRVYRLTENASELAQEVSAVMKNFESVYDAMWAEIQVDLDEAIEKAEQALKERSLIYRYLDQFPDQQSSISQAS